MSPASFAASPPAPSAVGAGARGLGSSSLAVGGAWRGVRSFLETPILDARKWAKVAATTADAVFLDLEDSVPPERKAEARDRVATVLADPGALADRVLVPRVNSLASGWGVDDVRTLAGCRPAWVAYPKARSAAEVRRVLELLAAGGAQAGLVVIVETAAAVLTLAEIADVPGVVALILGPADLALDAGWTMFDRDHLRGQAYAYPRSKLSLVGAATGLPVYDTVFVPDIRDLDAVRRVALEARHLGFTGMATFYPPHLDVIHQTFAASPAELEEARQLVAVYEAGLSEGRAAVTLGGRVVLVQDYARARRLLGGAAG